MPEWAIGCALIVVCAVFGLPVYVHWKLSQQNPLGRSAPCDNPNCNCSRRK